MRSRSVIMWLSVSAIVALFTLVAGVCHNKYEKNYYEEIGCKPEGLDESGCPTSYDCSALKQRQTDKCYYKGQIYNLGFELEKTPDAPCKVHCQCQNTIMTNDKTAFSCVNIECPEHLGVRPPPGQYMTYEHGECCSVGRAEKAAARTSKDVCQYKDETYLLGEKFFPEEDSCLECICKPGYKGELVEPFCQKIHCNLELSYGDRIIEGCVPIFYGENGCCPFGWRCPDKSDTVVPVASTSKSGQQSGKSCQFGDVTLRIGEKLNPDVQNPKAECTCRVPPHPVCIQPHIPYPARASVAETKH